MPRAVRMARPAILALLALLCCASCAGLAGNDQGVLQPQTVSGPCQVKKFFILRLTSTPTEMAVGNTGQACSLMLLNADLQIALNAALVTSQPEHGRATAALITGRREAAVSYVPLPGYNGPDRFGITLEPNAIGVTFNVTVQPAPPAA